LGGSGHALLVVAHQRAPAPVLAPFLYSEILFMVALGWLVFGDVPDLATLVGAGIVIGSGLYLLVGAPRLSGGGGSRRPAGPPPRRRSARCR
jgi:drug/metabolite transporter (DMT)-like permease